MRLFLYMKLNIYYIWFFDVHLLVTLGCLQILDIHIENVENQYMLHIDDCQKHEK